MLLRWVNNLAPYMVEKHKYLARFHRRTGPIWALLHVVFYFLCTHIFGMKEDVGLRFTAALLILGNRFIIPKDREPNFLQALYIEITLAFNLPILFTYTVILNDMRSYWVSSLVFASVLYAFGAYPLIALIAFPVLCFGMLYMQDIPILTAGLWDISGSIIMGWILMFLIIFIRRLQLDGALQVTQLKHDAEIHQRIILQKEVKEKEDRLNLEILQTYVSPSVRRELSEGRDPRETPRKDVNWAILISDMKGFTKAAQKLSPQNLGTYVNGYFDGIINGVFDGMYGEVDKLMGDAAMATFVDADSALKAYLAMRSCDAEGTKKYDYGIGISFGHVSYGNYGNTKKLDRTVIGDVVNEAQRIEKLCREYGVDTLLTEALVKNLSEPYPDLRVIDFVAVGWGYPKPIYEAFGHQNSELRAFKRESAPYLERAITAKIRGDMETFDHEIRGWILKFQDYPVSMEDSVFIRHKSKTLALPRVV